MVIHGRGGEEDIVEAARRFVEEIKTRDAAQNQRDGVAVFPTEKTSMIHGLLVTDEEIENAVAAWKAVTDAEFLLLAISGVSATDPRVFGRSVSDALIYLVTKPDQFGRASAIDRKDGPLPIARSGSDPTPRAFSN